MSLLVHQALHGYERGHRGLACSAELEMSERHLIDQLSDLSGYLTRAQDFEAYHTGYPAGRFYVIARTWLDRKAERSGTVFTHSLLLPLEMVAGLSDWGSLHGLFRQPASGAERELYRKPLTRQDSATPKLPILPIAHRTDLGVGWFGAERRPMLWEDPGTAEAAARWLWAWLPPWSRTSHSFCTFALGPRWIGERPFAWLARAPKAESAFYELEPRATLAGGPRSARGSQPLWASLFEADTPHPVQQAWSGALEEGISPQPDPLNRLLLQRVALGPQEGLSAALARLDGLARLGAARTAAADRDVIRLIEASRGAIEPGRGVLTLQDLVLRSPHRMAPARADDVAGALVALAQRLAPGLQVAEVDRVSALLETSRANELSEPIEEGLCRSFDSMSSAVQEAMFRVLHEVAPQLARRVMSELPVARAAELVEVVLPATPDPAALRGVAERYLTHAPEVATALVACDRIKAEELIPPLLELGPPWSAEDWWNVLHAASSPALLSALTSPTPDSLRGPLLRALVDRISMAELVGAPDPLRRDLFEEVLDRRLDLLRAEPARALRAAATLGSGDGRLVALVEQIGAESLRALVDFETPRDFNPRWMSRLASRVVPLLVDDLLHGLEAPLAVWLRRAGSELNVEATREVLRTTRPEQLRAAFEILTLREARELRTRRTLEHLLERWAEMPTDALATCAETWAGLLKLLKLEDRKLYQEQCALALARALSDADPRFEPVVLVAFPEVHQALCDKEDEYGIFIVRWIRAWIGGDWNKSKHLRKYMAAALVYRGWPPSVLQGLSHGERWVYEDLVERVLELPGGPAWLHRRA